MNTVIGVYAEIIDLQKRVATLESLLGLSPRPLSRTPESRDRFRAGRRLWNPQDDALLRTLYPHESTESLAVKLRRSVSSLYGRAKKLDLAKTEEYLASHCRLRSGTNLGVKCQFTKGHVPANKGLRRPGYAPGRMRETQFKKGQLPWTYMPVGSTRLIDGYLYRKTSDIRYVPYTRNWTLEHYLIWEKANGPVPAGCAIAFKNGDRRDIRLDNFECITRCELMARNTVHNLPPELRSTIQLLGALNRQIKRKARNDEKNQH